MQGKAKAERVQVTSRTRFYLAWGLSLLALYGTIFLAGFVVGVAQQMVAGLEAGVGGFTSMANWSFWR